MKLKKSSSSWKGLKGRSAFPGMIASIVRRMFLEEHVSRVEIWHDTEAHLASHDADEPNSVYIECWGDCDGQPFIIDIRSFKAEPEFISRFFDVPGQECICENHEVAKHWACKK